MDKTSTRCQVIGFAGCSASGKSTLAKAIAQKLGTSLISQDSFFRSPSAQPLLSHDLKNSFAHTQFSHKINDTNHPDGIDFDEFIKTVMRTIEADTAARKQFLVVEGFLLFTDPRLEALVDFPYFIDIPKDIACQRKRERSYRGCSVADFDVYFSYVWLRFQEHGCKRPNGTVTLDGTQPVEELTTTILQLLATKK